MKKNKLRYGDIIAESYYLESNNGKAIIFCAGIPGTSSYLDIAEEYVNQGYIFIQPKYLGSWESYGNFTIAGCNKTIEDFVEALRNKSVKTIFNSDFTVEISEIFLLGHSFGGSIALCSGAASRIDGIIALAPVLDYRSQGKGEYVEEKMDWLYDFIVAGFENVYRNFEKNDWESLLLNGLPLNANDYLEQLRTKRILLIHGKNDISINSSRSSKFYNELKEIGGNIIFNETEDDHSSVKSTTFSKITSWI